MLLNSEFQSGKVVSGWASDVKSVDPSAVATPCQISEQLKGTYLSCPASLFATQLFLSCCFFNYTISYLFLVMPALFCMALVLAVGGQLYIHLTFK